MILLKVLYFNNIILLAVWWVYIDREQAETSPKQLFYIQFAKYLLRSADFLEVQCSHIAVINSHSKLTSMMIRKKHLHGGDTI